MRRPLAPLSPIALSRPALFPLLTLLACGARSSLDAPDLVAGAGGSTSTTSSTSSAGTGGGGGSPPTTFVSVACGGAHLCAVTSTGQVFCWGYGGRGQLGDGLATGFSPTPVFAQGLSGAVSVAAGGEHSCALAQGTVFCWGHDSHGQIGDGASGESIDRPTPLAVALPEPAAAITAGGYHYGGGHTCALLVSGAVWCWGSNSGGQIGDGQSGFGVVVAKPSPVMLGGPAIAVAAGGLHTCALLASGAVSCWGQNENGQIGDGKFGSGAKAPLPTPVLGLPDKALALAAGDTQSCALLQSGEAWCWGLGGFGQFGLDPPGDLHTPALAFPGGALRAIDQGAVHGCVVRAGGEVECAGLDDLGELGSGDPGPFAIHATPVPVPLHDATALSAGTTTTCALREGGLLSCWGDWMGPLPVEIAPP